MSCRYLGIDEKYVSCLGIVGSRVTCNPPPTDTDRDWLLYVRVMVFEFDDFDEHMINNGWAIGGSRPEHSDAVHQFNSYTKTIEGIKENVIACSDYHFYQKFLKATHIAKKLNILDKADRIMLFQAILYGK